MRIGKIVSFHHKKTRRTKLCSSIVRNDPLNPKIEKEIPKFSVPFQKCGLQRIVDKSSVILHHDLFRENKNKIGGSKFEIRFLFLRKVY